MAITGILFSLAGGLCLFLYGMKVMSEGVQQAAGDRMQGALNFMTRNRFVAIFTGFAVTALVQSSSATTVMLVSFVNAGLLTLTQSIGVIMGANIGTTTTAWIVSLIGFKLDIAAFALPAIAIGFIVRMIKWKYSAWGEAFLGFGFIFLGLDFLNNALPTVSPDSLGFIKQVSEMGFLSIVVSLLTSTAVTLLMHSSAASITLIITLAYRGVINYPMAAAMILGANIGTTIDAIMAAFGAKTAAKQTALVHVLFNVGGSVLALVFFNPLLALVDLLTPGASGASGIAPRLAMFHSVFNIACTLVFVPFVKPFAALVTHLVKEKPGEKKGRGTYRFEYLTDKVPEMAVLQGVKEIQDMAGLASGVYAKVTSALERMNDTSLTEEEAGALSLELQEEARYAGEMREALTAFLIECSSHHLNPRTEWNVSLYIRIVAELASMTEDCYSIGMLLERGVKKHQIFKRKEMKALGPYMALVEEHLHFLRDRLGGRLNKEEEKWASALEEKIDKSRNKLRKLGRKRIEAGQDVRTELLFIDLVRRIENLGDYCYIISESLAQVR